MPGTAGIVGPAAVGVDEAVDDEADGPADDVPHPAVSKAAIRHVSGVVLPRTQRE
jgi:hypothetical protein